VDIELLMITHNRRPYVEKTLRCLLSDPTEFALHVWDNASTDGTAEVIEDLDDPRIVRRVLSKENVMQDAPTRWFLGGASTDLIGKVDDDTLVPTGWLETLAAAVDDIERPGMIGCWTFMPEDFERNRIAAENKIERFGQHQIIRDIAIGGTGILMRRSIVTNYLEGWSKGWSFPIDRPRMTLDGYVSGWYYPLLLAEHMDDPRSEHCLMNRTDGMGETAALTARARGFHTPEEYTDWIMADADKKLQKTVQEQVREYRRSRLPWYRAGRAIGRRIRR
jgi:glycosyltransferase involved in cell wall biosynthesis